MSKYTQRLINKMQDWGLVIEEIDDDIAKLGENGKAIVKYLNDIHFSMPLGIALRIHLCDKFSDSYDEVSRLYTFTLTNGTQVKTKDCNSENYDFTAEDLSEYTEVFISIIEKYNSESAEAIMSKLTKQEIRRMLKSETCLRNKMFLISFALHMNHKETNKFLTDILAEQTYNYRNPEEIIALFCQSHEEYNSYAEYERLKNRFNSLEFNDTEKKEQYTKFAKNAMESDIETEEELMDFLAENKANFTGYSQTAFEEFKRLYDQALSKATYMTSSYEFKPVTNPEQLSKEMLKCIPRATFEKTKDGKKIVSNDFINIYNGEKGQKSKKTKTTDLPKEITKNLPIADRLSDLLNRKKPVERKDLVFMKFYVFSLYLQEKEEYLVNDYFVFLDECNDILLRSGMSKLYAGNRFENLIMLSLFSSNPFEMFENIIENTFINEPSSTGC
ncbi:MAG: hypothetical protein ACI4W6_03265 [Acutalibacteraceae bacterium]